MKKIALGLMSGTSLDGLSMALGSFTERNRGQSLKGQSPISFQLLSHQTIPYPKAIFDSLNHSSNLSLPEISRLHFRIGKFYADSVQSFIKKSTVPLKDISVIGSHGQTLFHEPKGAIPNTFQIGEPSFMAQITGLPVVSDFRPRAIAAGGEGAPLIPFFDNYFFGKGPVRAFQNIGGIGNVTVVGKELNRPIAFDTGPGNCLIDWAVRKISGGKQSFDRDGNLASQGKVWMDLVEELADHPYFKRPPPKSTGRELFNEQFIPHQYKKRMNTHPKDFLASLTYFTAYTIAQSYKNFVLPKCHLREVVVNGGGEYNLTLLSYLKELLNPIPICSYKKFGIPAQAKEPLAFAFFALRAIEGKTNYISLDGKDCEELILGKITPMKHS